jgi:hypothetical protein
MPDLRRAWTEDDIARLKAMAGKMPAERIAADLGRDSCRSLEAGAFVAHQTSRPKASRMRMMQQQVSVP